MRSLLLLAGILLALWTPDAWQQALGWCLAGALPVLLFWRLARPGLLLAIGAAYATLVAQPIMTLPPLADGERLVVEARVRSVPSLDDSGWQFDADVIFPRQPDWRGQRWRIRLPALMPEPVAGELWQLALRFDPPRDAGERRLLLRERVSAQARMVDGPLNQRIEAAGPGLDALRARLARRIADRVADPAAGALLAALAVGVTGEVSTRQWQVFNATGITHLVAISGMHVTFFAMLSMAAARRLWPRLAGVRGMPRRERFAAACGILLALLYALLAGFSVPTQRTVVMLTAFVLARECGRCSTPAWSVGVALAAVLLFDPLAALSAGLWLSFLAVTAIVLLAGARLLPGASLPAACRLQWLVTVALLPVTVAIFGNFSAVGLLANAIAIPVFTLVLVPCVLVATFLHLVPLGLLHWCADLLVSLGALVAAATWPFLCWCAGLPGALWRTEAPLGWYALAMPAAVLALLPVRRELRLLSLVLLASVFLLRDPRPPHGQLWIDVPDRGRSGAVVLRTRGHLLLWGTGESFGAGGRAFARHVQPLLRSGSHGRIDLWLPGTLTRDVQAALALGSAQLPVERTLLPPARGVPPEMHDCAEAQWEWDGIQFTLQPTADGRACVLGAGVDVQQPGLWLGGADATVLPAAGGAVLRLVLDDSGLQQRERHLRL